MSNHRRLMTFDEFSALAADKGWSFSDLATRWGLSVSRISQISRDTRRPAHYEDSLRGLPRLRAGERAELRSERVAARRAAEAKRQRRSRASVASPATMVGDYWLFGIGDVLAALRDIKDPETGRVIAPTGSRGHIVARELDRYRLRFEGGERWLDEPTAEEWLAETGLTAPLEQLKNEVAP